MNSRQRRFKVSQVSHHSKSRRTRNYFSSFMVGNRRSKKKSRKKRKRERAAVNRVRGRYKYDDEEDYSEKEADLSVIKNFKE